MATETVEKKTENKETKRKWAKVQQKELQSHKLQRAEGSNFYNIWYHKYEGDYEHERYKATTRCNPVVDSGLTKADLINPENAFLCLHFARGACISGRNCMYLHRLPTAQDELRLSLIKDIFGRDRHGTDREDMSGVGNFNRPSKTIMAGGCQLGKYRKQVGDANWGDGNNETEEDWLSKCQEVLARHFGEWGSIERIDVKPKHDAAYVTYRLRCCAEFAKVAMSEQSLDYDEQLSVRWAREEPMPTTVAEQQAFAAQMADKLAQRGLKLNDERHPETGEKINPSADGQYPDTYGQQGSAEVDPTAAALWVEFEQYNDMMRVSAADAAAAAGISLPPGLDLPSEPVVPIATEQFTGHIAKKQRKAFESIARLNAVLNSIETTEPDDYSATGLTENTHSLPLPPQEQPPQESFPPQNLPEPFVVPVLPHPSAVSIPPTVIPPARAAPPVPLPPSKPAPPKPAPPKMPPPKKAPS